MFTNGFMQKGLEAYPAVVTFHNMLMLDMRAILRNRLSRTTVLWLLLAIKQRATFKKAAGVIFLSPYSRDTAAKKVRGIRKSPPSYPTAWTMISEPQNHRPRPVKETVNILYLSTLFSYKHQIEVVRAVHRLRQRTGKPVISVASGRTATQNIPQDSSAKYAA